MPSSDAAPDQAPEDIAASQRPRVSTGAEIRVRAIGGLPLVAPGDDLGAMLVSAFQEAQWAPMDCDVIVMASKLLSRSEGLYVDLSKVEVSEEAAALAQRVHKDPALVHVILQDSAAVSRQVPGVLITRHRLGHVSANAGIDTSNAMPPTAPAGSGPWVLRLPSDPDATARSIRTTLERHFGVTLAVVITDSLGRPFRNGSLGHVIGLAGLPPLSDERGKTDLCDRKLEHTFAAIGDMVAAAADLVMGQAGEGRGAAVVTGLRFEPSELGADALQRDPQRDLYA